MNGSKLMFTFFLCATEKLVSCVRCKFSQRAGVQDQHHVLIAELGSSGDTFALRERIFDGSHDDLSLSDYSINRESNGVCILTNHQHVKLLATLVIHHK